MVDESLILPNLLSDLAARRSGDVFLQEVAGPSFSYREINRLADRWGGAFARRGIGPSDRVLTMMHPGGDWLAVWIGLSRLRAIETGVSTLYRGRSLEYVITQAGPRAMVVSATCLPELTRDIVEASTIECVVVTGAGGLPEPPELGVPVISADDFLRDASETETASARRVQVWETACNVLTSGTTGPSKLVVAPWGLLYNGASGCLPVDDLSDQDALYSPFPVNHLMARYFIYLLMLAGGRVVLREAPSVEDYWDDVRRYRCTVGPLVGIGPLLVKRPEKPDDADNPLRAVNWTPLPPDHQSIAKRFGIAEMCTAYGSSEVGVVIQNAPNSTFGHIRRGYPDVEFRIVDENDIDVPLGESGELIVRTGQPWTLTTGYFGMPEATARAWRNGWFHTGDGFRQNEDGTLSFTDRIKDAIRRRGENISSFEVEAEVLSHPAVAECAAIAVPTESEDELKVVVVLREGSDITAGDLVDFVAGRAPKFMVPRYVEFVTALPRTEATSRVQKSELRKHALNERTWDRHSGT